MMSRYGVVSRKRSVRMARLALAGILAVGLSACGGGGWLGDPEDPPLPGERKSVLEIETDLAPEASAETMDPALPAPRANELWPQAGGFPDHAMGQLARGPRLEIVWRADIGAGSRANRRLIGQPIVTPDHVVAMDTDSHVTAIDRKSGARAWRVDVAPEGEERDVIGGGIGYGDDRIHVTTGYARLVTLDAATGKRLWTRQIAAPARAAPTILGGRVFVLTVDNRLLALDAAAGTPLWQHTGLMETASLLGAPNAAAAGRLVVVGYSSGELVALRAENGAVAWTDNLATLRRAGGASQLSDIRARPVIDDGLVVAISQSGRMMGIEQRSGLRVWQRDIGGVEMPWLAGNLIYQITAGGELVALVRQSGAVRWVTGLPRWRDPQDKEGRILWSGPILAGGRLIVVSSHGRALEFDPRTGEQMASWRLPGPTHIAPIVAGGRLYVLTDKGRLICYRSRPETGGSES